MSCPHCGSNFIDMAKVKATYHLNLSNIEIHCVTCSRDNPATAWIANDYKQKGLEATITKWGISATTLYRIPEIKALKAIKVINKLDPNIKKKVLAECQRG